jgi:hypothetical protein
MLELGWRRHFGGGGLGGVDLEGEVVGVLAVEGADALGLGARAVGLRPEFVVDVLAELAEVEVAGVIGDEGLDLERLGVFEVDDRAGDGGIGFVDDLAVRDAFDGVALDGAALIAARAAAAYAAPADAGGDLGVQRAWRVPGFG